MENSVKIKCAECGADIDITSIIDKAVEEAIKAYQFNISSKGGKKTNARKRAAQQESASQLNAAYTTEKRKAAWEKRKANMALAKKNKAEE